MGLYVSGVSISGELPDISMFDRSPGSILESLCGLRQADRLAIKYVTHTELLKTSPPNLASPRSSPIRCVRHAGHGTQCFVRAAKEGRQYDDDWELIDCGQAHESLRAAAFARLLRHHILTNGKDKGYQDINVMMGIRDKVQYLVLSTDDDKMGRSHVGDVHHHPLQKLAIDDAAEIDVFALVGGSCILDQVAPQGWTPHWSTEKK